MGLRGVTVESVESPSSVWARIHGCDASPSSPQRRSRVCGRARRRRRNHGHESPGGRGVDIVSFVVSVGSLGVPGVVVPGLVASEVWGVVVPVFVVLVIVMPGLVVLGVPGVVAHSLAKYLHLELVKLSNMLVEWRQMLVKATNPQ